MDQKIIITGGEGTLATAISQVFDFVETPGRLELNVSSETSVKDYFQKQNVKLLICCAGLIDEKPLLRLSERSWDQVLDVNLRGAQRCAQAVVRQMNQQGGGHIIFIGSYLGEHPAIGTAAYSAAKAALTGLTHSLAQELGEANIRVNLILPGFLETKMTQNVSKERKEHVLASHALNRFNTPEKVAQFIKILDEEMLHTSGQVFNLDSRIL